MSRRFIVTLAVSVFLAAGAPRAAPAQSGYFIRGDVDGSGGLELTDGIFTLGYLFLGARTPPCLDAADVNDSGEVDISDAVALFGWLFLGVKAPPAPGPDACGSDPTEDGFGCIYHQPCAQVVTEKRAMVQLIEYNEQIDGLVNFVYECHKRNIPTYASVGGMYVSQNCETFRTLSNYGMEVVGQTGPILWGMSYEEQLPLIVNTKTTIEACLGKPLRIISTKLFGTDGTTCRIAQELGIPYVLARGTTTTRSTIYKPIEYDLKIISVSNMESETWAYGSLCDWSIYSRGGTPQDFMAELHEAFVRHDKVTPVCHTRLGGLKQNWYEVYMDFFDNSGIKFEAIEDFTSIVDAILPMAQIPKNWANPYGPTPTPLIPFDEEPNVNNPCQIDDLPPVPGNGDVGEKIVFYHNGLGQMCLDFLDFLETVDYPLEEHLITEPDFWEGLDELETQFGSSEGVSQTFGFFPIIFIKTKAYSGFDSTIGAAILQLIAE